MDRAGNHMGSHSGSRGFARPGRSQNGLDSSTQSDQPRVNGGSSSSIGVRQYSTPPTHQERDLEAAQSEVLDQGYAETVDSDLVPMRGLPGSHSDVQQPEESQHTGVESIMRMPQQQPRQGRASSGVGVAAYINLDTRTSRELWELFYDIEKRILDLAQLREQPGHGSANGAAMLRSHLIRDKESVYDAIVRKYLHETPTWREEVRVQGTAYVGNGINLEDAREEADEFMLTIDDDHPFEYPEDAYPPQR